MKHVHARRIGDRAFTLVEILVALAVFLLMVLMLVGLTDGVARTTGQSQRRIGTDADVRQAIDRMSEDFSHAIARSDLPFRMEKKDGNDSISFLAVAQGYTQGRGLSVISYRVADSALQRGAETVSWTNTGSHSLAFMTLNDAAATPGYLAIDETNFEQVASDVFRLEIAFLMGDGTINAAPGIVGGSSTFRVASIAATPGASDAGTIRAVIIGIAALDRRARDSLDAAAAQALIAGLPDVASGQGDILSAWDGYLAGANPAIPKAARESIRICQRFIFLNN